MRAAAFAAVPVLCGVFAIVCKWFIARVWEKALSAGAEGGLAGVVSRWIQSQERRMARNRQSVADKEILFIV